MFLEESRLEKPSIYQLVEEYIFGGTWYLFTVESHLNDDVGTKNFIPNIKLKYGSFNNNQHNLLAAFRPTRENNNDSKQILLDPFFKSFEEIYLFYLENKWNYHAKLLLNEIINHYTGINNIKHVIINADNGLPGVINDSQRKLVKINQIKSELSVIFP